MANLTRRTLFQGPLARLVDIHCRESSRACSGEERAKAHELVVIRAGVFLKHAATSSREALVAEPMHALLINKDEPFRISHPAGAGDDCTAVEFSSDAVIDVVETVDPGVRDRPGAPFRVTHAPLGAASRLLLHRLRVEALDDRDGLACEERLLGILGHAVTDGYRAHGRALAPQRRTTRMARREMVERVRESLALAPTERWSLGRLAAKTESSPFHLARVFRAATGMPIHRYLLRLRLSLALEQLGGGSGQLSRVALGAGFASHSHFSAAFRKVFGVAPTALAQRRSVERAGAVLRVTTLRRDGRFAK